MAGPIRLGVCLPYGRQEITYLALGVARLALSRGIPVSLFSTRIQDRQVDPAWDDRVADGRKVDFREWSSRHTHLAWFEYNRTRTAVAKSLGLHNTFVFCWTRIDSAQLEGLAQFDEVFAPHEAAGAMLDRYDIPWSLCPWDAGQPSQARDGLLRHNELRLYVPIDGSAAKRLGTVLFSTLAMLLPRSPQLRLTIGQFRNWPRAAHGSLSSLLREHPQRVQVTRNQSQAQHLSQFALHDWTFWPAVHSPAGLTALESLAAGVPVTTFNVPPFPQLLPVELGRRAIACDLQFNAWGLPSVSRPGLPQLLQAFQHLLSSPQLLAAGQGPWPELADRRRQFENSWFSVWGG